MVRIKPRFSVHRIHQRWQVSIPQWFGSNGPRLTPGTTKLPEFPSHNGSDQTFRKCERWWHRSWVSIPQWFGSNYSSRCCWRWWCEYVSIPQWFGSNYREERVLEITKVSIPQWFGSNDQGYRFWQSICYVSIPQWFGSNKDSILKNPQPNIRFHPTMVRIKPKFNENEGEIVYWFPSHNGSDQTSKGERGVMTFLGFHPTMVRIKLEYGEGYIILLPKFPSHNGSDQTGWDG